MDDIVKAALAKWPNVPHCYGWLALDARGQWRMRDARCQALNLPGDVIRHPALIAFIQRNYAVDERGCWYFQNGPQRVYVELAATPFVARLATPELNAGLILHTDTKLEWTQIKTAYMDAEGRFFLYAEQVLAILDDRDLAQLLPNLFMQDALIDEKDLLTWLSTDASTPALMLHPSQNCKLKIQRMNLDEIMHKLRYQPSPASLHT